MPRLSFTNDISKSNSSFTSVVLRTEGIGPTAYVLASNLNSNF